MKKGVTLIELLIILAICLILISIVVGAFKNQSKYNVTVDNANVETGFHVKSIITRSPFTSNYSIIDSNGNLQFVVKKSLFSNTWTVYEPNNKNVPLSESEVTTIVDDVLRSEEESEN